jgi:large subunit ribosomal protein L2
MGIKSYKPTTPTLRYKQISDKAEITAAKPYHPLTVGRK